MATESHLEHFWEWPQCMIKQVSTKGDFAPQEIIGNVGGIWDCVPGGVREGITSTQEIEVMAVNKHLPCRGQSLRTKNYLDKRSIVLRLRNPSLYELDEGQIQWRHELSFDLDLKWCFFEQAAQKPQPKPPPLKTEQECPRWRGPQRLGRRGRSNILGAWITLMNHSRNLRITTSFYCS